MGYHPKPTPCFFLRKKKKNGESKAQKFSNSDWCPSLLDSGTTHSTQAREARVLSTIFKSRKPCHRAMVEQKNGVLEFGELEY